MDSLAMGVKRPGVINQGLCADKQLSLDEIRV